MLGTCMSKMPMITPMGCNGLSKYDKIYVLLKRFYLHVGDKSQKDGDSHNVFENPETPWIEISCL